MEETKRCKKCSLIKPIDDFWQRDKIKKNGRWYHEVHTTCKQCCSRKSMEQKDAENELNTLFKNGLSKCRWCKLIKPIELFERSPKSKHGILHICKDCRNERTRFLIKTNPARHAKAKEKNKRTNHNPKYKETRRRCLLNSREKNAQRERELLRTSPSFKMKKYLRRDIRDVLKNQNTPKAYRLQEVLGCSIDELRAYIESKFKVGMTWDNWTRFGWHIDHIKPCASFDLSDPEEQKKCFHYTNLQPLWWRDNLSKGAKLIY